jgi:hypothetical protein
VRRDQVIRRLRLYGNRKFGKPIPSSDNRAMRGLRRKQPDEAFPDDFRSQRIRVESALEVAELPAPETAAYSRQHLETAKDLLLESYDKRFTPSSFVTEESYGFRVGWCSSGSGIPMH